MSVKTIRMIPTLFVIGVLGAGAAMVAPTIRQMLEERGNPVVVSVDFDPLVRSGVKPPGRAFPDHVVVSLTVGGVISPNQPVLRSPWTRTLYPGRGKLVVVTATQVYGSRLGCSITQHGQMPSLQTKIGPSAVSCKMTTI